MCVDLRRTKFGPKVGWVGAGMRACFENEEERLRIHTGNYII